MRIYRIRIEHTLYGRNYDKIDVEASTAEEAIKKAKKNFKKGELVEEVELLAEADIS